MNKEDAINKLTDMANEIGDFCDYVKHVSEEAKDEMDALEMAIKALKQEPIKLGCSECKIFDKIRADIEQLHLIGYATIDGKREIASRAVLDILDKYKAESEVEE